MEVSRPNENGVLPESHQEVVARRNRSFAAINIAYCEDGFYRMSVELHYRYGGFSRPIFATGTRYATAGAARMAGLQELLHRWHKLFHSDPVSVHEELADLRDQVAAQLRQPSLF